MSSRSTLLLTSLLVLTSCQVGSSERRPEAEVPEAPEAWSADTSADAPPLAPGRPWWRSFDAPELERLVEEALTNNRNVRASLARLDAARAQARIAGAERLPTANAAANSRRSKQVFVGLPIPGGGDVLSNQTDSFGVSLDVSWELDLWGRLSARGAAAEEDLLASGADHAGLRQSLAAQVAKGWFAWQEARLQEALAGRNVTAYRQSAEVARRRFEGGRGESLDVRRTESALAGAEAMLEARRQTVERTERQVEILLGRYPAGELAAEPGLPDAPGLPGVGLPADLLERRPDLVAARARLRATDHRLDEARANLLPRLSLTGSVGRSSSDPSDLVDNDFTAWSIAAGLLQPLFQGGRLRANVELADARVREAAESYAQALLTAFQEVETLLAVEEALASRLEHLERAGRESRSARELAAERYAAGRIDLTTLLDAQRSALAAESRTLSARFQRVEARIDLFLALGGGLE